MKKIMFFISHQPNPRFVKQINFLSKNGYKVSVMYFKRKNLADLNNIINKKVKMFLIGEIEDGKYLKRLLSYFKYISYMYKILKKEKPDKIIITNIDILYFLILLHIKSEIIVEISDLRDYTFKDNFFSKIQQYVDNILFSKYVDKMIFTSLKFYDVYYKDKFKKNYFILENKPLLNTLPPKIDKVKQSKIVIGIVGLLLQGNPYKTLLNFIKDNDEYEVHIYGKGKYKNLIEEYANKYNNIKYFGEYNFFKDSSKIYSSIDILYMPYDTKNGSLNNKIALPNKLYEAMYFQVPIITSKDSYLGEIVDKLQIGYIVECCNEYELNQVLKKLIENLDKIQLNFKQLNSNLYIADNDYKKLLKFID